MPITTAKLFALKDYAKALEHKEQMSAIMRRVWVNETMGNN